MDDKNQKSIDTISKRIDNLEVAVEIPLDLNYMTIMLKGESPQYNVRFAAWAKSVLEHGENIKKGKAGYMENLIQAMLSHFAIESLTGGGEYSEEFMRGQANGILFLYEEMQRLSNVNEFISDKDKT